MTLFEEIVSLRNSVTHWRNDAGTVTPEPPRTKAFQDGAVAAYDHLLDVLDSMVERHAAAQKEEG